MRPERRFMFAVRMNRRVLPDLPVTEITTYTRTVEDANLIEVEAGTTGFKGGDAGHGGRTYFRIQDVGGTCIQAIPLGRNGDEGVEVILGGDAELTSIIRALRFITRTLEDQKNKVFD